MVETTNALQIQISRVRSWNQMLHQGHLALNGVLDRYLLTHPCLVSSPSCLWLAAITPSVFSSIGAKLAVGDVSTALASGWCPFIRGEITGSASVVNAGGAIRFSAAVSIISCWGVVAGAGAMCSVVVTSALSFVLSGAIAGVLVGLFTTAQLFYYCRRLSARLPVLPLTRLLFGAAGGGSGQLGGRRFGDAGCRLLGAFGIFFRLLFLVDWCDGILQNAARVQIF